MKASGIDTAHALNTSHSQRFRDILRWWPLLLVTMGLALGAAGWAHQHTVPTYVATTRIVVVPLPQWDETFLGTDLVRDSGDATRTAATTAAELQSDRYIRATADYLGGEWTAESVGAAITVLAPGETNTIEISARSSDPGRAEKLASGFASAIMADRWQGISAQLDARITALRNSSLIGGGDPQGTNPTASEQAAQLQTITIVRDSRIDPTLRVGSTSRAERASEMPLAVTLSMAALGGLFVGVLAAAAIEFVRRSKNGPIKVPTAVPNNGLRDNGLRTDSRSDLVERKHVDAKSR